MVKIISQIWEIEQAVIDGGYIYNSISYTAVSILHLKFPDTEEEVREAWMNCLVHRDCSFSGSVIVNIYGDRMEFVSWGGLVPGLELDSIFLGVSQSRNPNLAALFYRMRLIGVYRKNVISLKKERM